MAAAGKGGSAWPECVRALVKRHAPMYSSTPYSRHAMKVATTTGVTTSSTAVERAASCAAAAAAADPATFGSVMVDIRTGEKVQEGQKRAEPSVRRLVQVDRASARSLADPPTTRPPSHRRRSAHRTRWPPPNEHAAACARVPRRARRPQRGASVIETRCSPQLAEPEPRNSSPGS